MCPSLVSLFKSECLDVVLRVASSQSHLSYVHGFRDVSVKAYGAAAYLTTVYRDGNMCSVIIALKTCMASIKFKLYQG